MSRYVRNPWAKKSKRGMKSLGKMFDTATKIGAAMYTSSKTKTPTSPDMSTSNNSIPGSSIGCIVVIVGVFVAIVVMLGQDDFFHAICYSVIVLGVTLLSFLIISYVFPDDCERESSTQETSDENNYNSEACSAVSKELEKELVAKIINMSSLDDIEESLKKLDSVSYREQLLLKSLDSALLHICGYLEVSSDVEQYIDSIELKYLLSDKMQGLGNYVEYIKMLIVQDILKGVLPKRVSISQNPINMQINEVPIFVFTNTVYYEETSVKTYLGASSGFSVRVCKGVYYRVGAFKGEPLITTSLKPKYGGSLVFTNLNIYFYSTEKTFKFPYSKILSYVPSEDAIGIQLDRANAKTVYIKNIDGRFAFNLVTNIKLIGA